MSAVIDKRTGASFVGLGILIAFVFNYGLSQSGGGKENGLDYSTTGSTNELRGPKLTEPGGVGIVVVDKPGTASIASNTLPAALNAAAIPQVEPEVVNLSGGIDQTDFVPTEVWHLRRGLWVEPMYFSILHMSYPTMERILSHQAYMRGSALTAVEAKRLSNNPDIIYLEALQNMCPNCIKAVFFHEKNIAGRLLSISEVKAVLANGNLEELIASAKSDDYILSLFDDSKKIN